MRSILCVKGHAFPVATTGATPGAYGRQAIHDPRRTRMSVRHSIERSTSGADRLRGTAIGRKTRLRRGAPGLQRHDRQAPALIARCARPDDVARAVKFARDHELLVAVRGGGHNGAGWGTCDDGVVIDLSRWTTSRSTPRPAPSVSAVVPRGARSTPPRTSTDWPRRVGSSRPRGSAAHPRRWSRSPDA